METIMTYELFKKVFKNKYLWSLIRGFIIYSNTRLQYTRHNFFDFPIETIIKIKNYTLLFDKLEYHCKTINSSGGGGGVNNNCQLQFKDEWFFQILEMESLDLVLFEKFYSTFKIETNRVIKSILSNSSNLDIYKRFMFLITLIRNNNLNVLVKLDQIIKDEHNQSLMVIYELLNVKKYYTPLNLISMEMFKYLDGKSLLSVAFIKDVTSSLSIFYDPNNNDHFELLCFLYTRLVNSSLEDQDTKHHQLGHVLSNAIKYNDLKLFKFLYQNGCTKISNLNVGDGNDFNVYICQGVEIKFSEFLLFKQSYFNFYGQLKTTPLENSLQFNILKLIINDSSGSFNLNSLSVDDPDIADYVISKLEKGTFRPKINHLSFTTRCLRDDLSNRHYFEKKTNDSFRFVFSGYGLESASKEKMEFLLNHSNANYIYFFNPVINQHQDLIEKLIRNSQGNVSIYADTIVDIARLNLNNMVDTLLSTNGDDTHGSSLIKCLFQSTKLESDHLFKKVLGICLENHILKERLVEFIEMYKHFPFPLDYKKRESYLYRVTLVIGNELKSTIDYNYCCSTKENLKLKSIYHLKIPYQILSNDGSINIRKLIRIFVKSNNHCMINTFINQISNDREYYLRYSILNKKNKSFQSVIELLEEISIDDLKFICKNTVQSNNYQILKLLLNNEISNIIIKKCKPTVDLNFYLNFIHCQIAFYSFENIYKLNSCLQLLLMENYNYIPTNYNGLSNIINSLNTRFDWIQFNQTILIFLKNVGLNHLFSTYDNDNNDIFNNKINFNF